MCKIRTVFITALLLLTLPLVAQQKNTLASDTTLWIPYTKGGKFGLENVATKKRSEAVYDTPGYFKYGLCAIRQKCCYGLLNKKLEWVLPPEYDFIEVIDSSRIICYKNGLSELRQNNKPLIPPAVGTLRYLPSAQCYTRMQDSTWNIFDEKGILVCSCSYKYDLIAFQENLILLNDYSESKNLLLSKNCDTLYHGDKDVYLLWDNKYLVDKYGSIQIFDQENKLIKSFKPQDGIDVLKIDINNGFAHFYDEYRNYEKNGIIEKREVDWMMDRNLDTLHLNKNQGYLLPNNQMGVFYHSFNRLDIYNNCKELVESIKCQNVSSIFYGSRRHYNDVHFGTGEWLIMYKDDQKNQYIRTSKHTYFKKYIPEQSELNFHDYSVEKIYNNIILRGKYNYDSYILNETTGKTINISREHYHLPNVFDSFYSAFDLTNEQITFFNVQNGIPLSTFSKEAFFQPNNLNIDYPKTYNHIDDTIYAYRRVKVEPQAALPTINLTNSNNNQRYIIEIINNTSQDFNHICIIGELVVQIEAQMPDGKWRPVDRMPIVCGNALSYPKIESGSSFSGTMPAYSGYLSYPIRAKLNLFHTERVNDYFEYEKVLESFYITSNIIEGRLNPGQFIAR